MTDATLQTTRFLFQKTGGKHVIEPADYDFILDTVDANLAGAPAVAADFTLTSGVAFTSEIPQSLRRLRLTLTALRVTASNAQKYGHTDLVTLPNKNLIIVGARTNLVATKDGAQIQSADVPTFALGTVAASNTTLATTMQNLTNLLALAAGATAPAQKNGASVFLAVAAGASNKVILNIGATGNTGGGDGYVDFSGTVDVFYFDLGTFS